MAWWVKVAGTGTSPYTQERWDERRLSARNRSLFPKRPRIARGDHLVVYASGSAAEYGEGRFFAVERVVSDEPAPSGHDRWRWQLETELVIGVPLLAPAPALREIGVSPKSLRQHSHIRLADAQGELAHRLIADATGINNPKAVGDSGDDGKQRFRCAPR